MFLIVSASRNMENRKGVVRICATTSRSYTNLSRCDTSFWIVLIHAYLTQYMKTQIICGVIYMRHTKIEGHKIDVRC